MPGLILFNRHCCFSSDDVILPAAGLLACHLLQLCCVLSLLSLVTVSQRHSYKTEFYDLSVESFNRTEAALLAPHLRSDVTCNVSAFVAAGTVGFRLLLLLCCCLLEASCAVASCWCRSVSDYECESSGQWRRLRSKGRSVTRLVKARLFLFILEILWHIISLPLLIVLLLPWTLIRHLPVGIAALNDCANRSVAVRLLAAVSVIDWTAALLIAGTIVCLLRRLGCGGWCCQCRRVSSQRQLGQIDLKNSSSGGCYGNCASENFLDKSNASAKLPFLLSPAKSSATSVRYFGLSSTASTPFGLTDAAIRLMPLLADLDLVASDVAAGLVLLRRQQRLRQRLELREGSKHVLDYMSGRPVYSTTRFYNLANSTDRSEIELALRCAKLSLAARACRHGNKTNRSVAVRCSLKRLGIGENEFSVTHASRNLYAGFDYASGSVVIVVASKPIAAPSMAELANGVAPIPLPAGLPDAGVEWFGHADAVRAAIQLNEELARLDVLNSSTTAEVTLTGHGVGAGAAVIFTLMALARGDAWSRRARVLALAPPGNLLGREAATLARRFATAVVVGRDAVARLGLSQAATLRRRIVRLLAGCQAHRWSIICRHLIAHQRLSQCCRQRRMPTSNADLATSLDESTDPDASTVETSSVMSPERSALQLPGRVLHVVRARGTDGKPVFHALRADGTDFDEILASPSMLRDHSPGYAVFALAAVLSDYDRLLPSPRGSFCDLPEQRQEQQLASPPSSVAVTAPTTASLERRLKFRPTSVDSSANNASAEASASLPAARQSISPFSSSSSSVASGVGSDGLSSSILGAPTDAVADVVVASSASTQAAVTAAAAATAFSASSTASALMSMMPHSHTMPAAVLRNFGLPSSMSSTSSSGQAPIATPESLSLASMASSSASLSDLSSRSGGGGGGYRRSLGGGATAVAAPSTRPLSDLFGYCYYLFPDEEAGQRRPFDDILPRPRVNFGCIAAAMSASTPPAAQFSGAAGKSSISSSCETITECDVATVAPPAAAAPASAAAAAAPAATAAAIAVAYRIDNEEDDSSGNSDLESAERTPRLLRSGVNIRLLSTAGDSSDADEKQSISDVDDVESPHDDTDDDDDDDNEDGRLYMTMDSDASGMSLQTVIAGKRGGDYV